MTVELYVQITSDNAWSGYEMRDTPMTGWGV